jgi:hypothetical protein
MRNSDDLYLDTQEFTKVELDNLTLRRIEDRLDMSTAVSQAFVRDP